MDASTAKDTATPPSDKIRTADGKITVRYLTPLASTGEVRLDDYRRANSASRHQQKEAHFDRTATSAERTISFGPFLLFPKQWLLLKGDKSIRIGSRALNILIALVERPGELVSKEELMARVWPNTFVQPANLTVHIAALRRALGDGREGNRYLVNIPGHGYRFVTPVFLKDEPFPVPAQPIATNGPHNLPVRVTKPVGRAETSRSLAMRLPQERIALDELGGATALPATPGTIEIEFATGARMRITGLIDASTVRAVVTALAKVKRR